MTDETRPYVVAFLIIAAVLVAVGMTEWLDHWPTSSSPAPVFRSAPARCHARDGGQLPDPSCTPGSIDPAVTAETLSATICRPGYTATVRPSSSYTSALKRAQIIAYGYRDRRSSDYEEDHLISLELGGAPADPRNLWPEPGGSPNAKDRVENLLHRAVCDHRIALATAQREIAGDWRQVTNPGG